MPPDGPFRFREDSATFLGGLEGNPPIVEVAHPLVNAGRRREARCGGKDVDFGTIRYGAEIEAAATKHHIDPQLLAAVAAQETGGPGARSGSNIVGDSGHGHGVFQIDDRSWSFAKTPAAMNPSANADFAAGMLADNLQRYGGNVKMALSAYNAGSPTATGTATTWANGTTLGYADSVLAHYSELGGTGATGAVSAADLAAESGENLANVNALSNAYDAYTGSSADSSSALGAPQNPSPYTPVATYQSLTSSSQQLGAQTNSTMANMIDEGDVFGTGDDDDA